MNNKKVFTVKDVDGNEVELCVIKPTAKTRVHSQLVFNKALREAIDNGSILQRNLEDYAEKLGLWNKEKSDKVESIASRLREMEKKILAEANAFASKEEARDCAFEMRKLRWEMIDINRSKNDLYPYTCEAYAEDARMKYFVSQCTLDNTTGKPYWRSYEDYCEASETDAGHEAMIAYMELTYGDMGEIGADWPESKFLVKYKYVDSKLRPIDKNGNLVDIESGRRINENGQYVLDDGVTFCDRDGNPLDASGQYVVDTKEFVDEIIPEPAVVEVVTESNPEPAEVVEN